MVPKYLWRRWLQSSVEFSIYLVNSSGSADTKLTTFSVRMLLLLVKSIIEVAVATSNRRRASQTWQLGQYSF